VANERKAVSFKRFSSLHLAMALGGRWTRCLQSRGAKREGNGWAGGMGAIALWRVKISLLNLAQTPGAEKIPSVV